MQEEKLVHCLLIYFLVASRGISIGGEGGGEFKPSWQRWAGGRGGKLWSMWKHYERRLKSNGLKGGGGLQAGEG